MTHAKSALCTECPVVALARCSLSVAANVSAKGCRPLELTGDIFMTPSLLVRGEQVDMWTLRAMSIAARRSPADGPDNRPLSGGYGDRWWPRGLMVGV